MSILNSKGNSFLKRRRIYAVCFQLFLFFTFPLFDIIIIIAYVQPLKRAK